MRKSANPNCLKKANPKSKNGDLDSRFGRANQKIQIESNNPDAFENRKIQLRIWFSRITRIQIGFSWLMKEANRNPNQRISYSEPCRWLPTEESNGIPEYPSLYIGVGTITVNDKNEILVIKEKVRWYNNWKFPGGYVDKGESILDAAVRIWLEWFSNYFMEHLRSHI